MLLSPSQLTLVLQRVAQAAEWDWVNLADIESAIDDVIEDGVLSESDRTSLVLQVVVAMLESHVYRPILMNSKEIGGKTLLNESVTETKARIEQSCENIGLRESQWVGLFSRIDG